MGRFALSVLLYGLTLSCSGPPEGNSDGPLPLSCPVPFEEPDTECRPAPVSEPPGNWSSKIVFALPAEAHCGADHDKYWLSGDEPAHLALEVGSGPGYSGPARQIQVVVLVDGLASGFRIDGGNSSKLTSFELEEASSRRLELVLDEVSPGKHVVNVVVLFNHFFAPAILSADLVVLRDATCNDGLPSPVQTQPSLVQDGASYLIDGQTGSIMPWVNQQVAPVHGGIPLVWHVAEASEGPVGRALVVLLDGQQVALDELGSRPYVEVPPGSGDREVDFTLGVNPGDGAEHQVHVLMINGLDIEAVAPSGEVLQGRPFLDSLASFRFIE